uniref:SGF29 C-terminal domain-containing protein n=1 Tax=Kalanchoe fedtschenkoi TaxID=63787 RepID=A0A7N0TP45_KALFE
MSAPDAAAIIESAKEIDRLRDELKEVIQEINKLHKKLQTTPEVVERPGDNTLSRLRYLYTQGKELSQNEENVSNQLLKQLDALLPSGPSGKQKRRIGTAEGNDLKKKRMKTDSDIQKLSTSMRNHLDIYANLKGEEVAARVRVEGDKEEWLVVKVQSFDRETRLFEVVDEEPAEDEEGGVQRKYKLPTSHIIPFPKKTEPGSAQDYPPGRPVLAVYPGTSALYKATVVNANRKRKTDE